MEIKNQKLLVGLSHLGGIRPNYPALLEISKLKKNRK